MAFFAIIFWIISAIFPKLLIFCRTFNVTRITLTLSFCYLFVVCFYTYTCPLLVLNLLPAVWPFAWWKPINSWLPFLPSLSLALSLPPSLLLSLGGWICLSLGRLESAFVVDLFKIKWCHCQAVAGNWHTAISLSLEL